jgi:hypothetical protein
MREIKFRIWDNITKKFDPQIYRAGEQFGHPSSCDWTPLQYTGVQDKNKKDVYDGDILRNQLNGNYCYVRWACDMEYAGWSLARPDEPIGNLFLNKIYKNLEVVGNIFENPEYLKTGVI